MYQPLWVNSCQHCFLRSLIFSPLHCSGRGNAVQKQFQLLYQISKPIRKVRTLNWRNSITYTSSVLFFFIVGNPDRSVHNFIFLRTAFVFARDALNLFCCFNDFGLNMYLGWRANEDFLLLCHLQFLSHHHSLIFFCLKEWTGLVQKLN